MITNIEEKVMGLWESGRTVRSISGELKIKIDHVVKILYDFGYIESKKRHTVYGRSKKRKNEPEKTTSFERPKW